MNGRDSMIQIGETVKLSNDKQYLVVNKMTLHNLNYVYLVTNSRPLEIIIATQKIDNGNIVLEEVKDNNELDYILSQFVLNTKEND